VSSGIQYTRLLQRLPSLLRSRISRWRVFRHNLATATTFVAAIVTLKCHPMKNPPGRNNHGFDMFPLIKILPVSPAPWKCLSIIGSSPRKVFPGRQFTGKNPSRPGSCRGGEFLPVNCQPARDFFGARFYNGTPGVDSITNDFLASRASSILFRDIQSVTVWGPSVSTQEWRCRDWRSTAVLCSDHFKSATLLPPLDAAQHTVYWRVKSAKNRR